MSQPAVLSNSPPAAAKQEELLRLRQQLLRLIVRSETLRRPQSR